MSKEIDHRYTSEIVCPYCGEEMFDSWECDDSGIRDCYECGKEFSYERNIEVTYCSSKIEK